nr:M48 family metallopeptidase [Leptolyngbya sp. FACHB-17]
MLPIDKSIQRHKAGQLRGQIGSRKTLLSSQSAYFLQRMKTKWGSCNPKAKHIRLNTELVKKPKDLLEYVIVHELAHLIEPTHSDRFIALLDQYYPTWREARAELNELPLSAEAWAE